MRALKGFFNPYTKKSNLLMKTTNKVPKIIKSFKLNENKIPKFLQGIVYLLQHSIYHLIFMCDPSIQYLIQIITTLFGQIVFRKLLMLLCLFLSFFSLSTPCIITFILMLTQPIVFHLQTSYQIHFPTIIPCTRCKHNNHI